MKKTEKSLDKSENSLDATIMDSNKILSDKESSSKQKKSVEPETIAISRHLEIIENVQKRLEGKAEQEDLTTVAEDIKELDEQAQSTAAQRQIDLESLILHYESTGEFTIDGLKEKVDAHKELCRAARRRRQAGAQDFFNQKMSQSKNGRNGSTP